MRPARLSVCALAFSAVAAQASAADQDIDLDGTWESIACELRPQVGQDGVAP